MKLRVLLFSALFAFIYAHCVHDEFIATHPTVHHTTQVRYNQIGTENGRAVHASGGLRIHFYTDTLDSDLSSQTTLLSLMKGTILPNTVNKYKELLNVEQVSGNLNIDRPCVTFQNEGETIYCMDYQDLTCSEFGAIPSSHYSSQTIYDMAKDPSGETTGGVGIADADIVIYVTAKNTATCQNSASTLAYATHCSQDQNDRPVAGYINFCPGSLDASQTERLFYTTMHEVGHVLGFSSSLYPYYRYANGNARTLRQINGSGYIYNKGTPPADADSSTTLNSLTVRSKTANFLIMDNVRDKVREHFDCSTLSGLELEDQGGAGTAKSHPEMRIYFSDFMNGIIPDFPVISESSLAVFEGTGWYTANYDKADFHAWGYKAGCTFVDSKCVSSGTSQNTLHFCTTLQTSQEIRCTQDLKGFGLCNLNSYGSNLDSEYQYFNDPKQGGGVALIDYCPIYVPFSFNGGIYPSGKSECSNSSRKPSQNVRGEKYGAGSKCVVNTLLSREYVGSQNSALGGCFQMDCKVDYVRILIGDTFVNCGKSESGDSKSTANYKGTFVCPVFDIACPPGSTNTCDMDCGTHGYCEVDKCVCASGWDGATCNTYVGSASSIYLSFAAVMIAIIAHLLF